MEVIDSLCRLVVRCPKCNCLMQININFDKVEIDEETNTITHLGIAKIYGECPRCGLEIK